MTQYPMRWGIFIIVTLQIMQDSAAVKYYLIIELILHDKGCSACAGHLFKNIVSGN